MYRDTSDHSSDMYIWQECCKYIHFDACSTYDTYLKPTEYVYIVKFLLHICSPCYTYTELHQISMYGENVACMYILMSIARMTPI